MSFQNSKLKEIQDATNRALDWTRKIVERYGPRLTGDESTKQSAEEIKKEMQSFCDSVQIESFNVHPKAFLGWLRLISVLYILSTISIWFNYAYLAAIGMTVGLFIMTFQFIYYKKLIDPFYPKRIGYNVIGVVNPSKEVKQQIIVSGHHDSAYICNFYVHQPELYSLRTVGSLGFIILMWILSWIWGITQSITGNPPFFALIWKIIAGISCILVIQLFFYATNKGTPGAGDNLIAVGIILEIGKYFKAQRQLGHGLEHTRIILASWDAEEAGLRGSWAYCKSHKKELLQLPTWNFNIECPYQYNELTFGTKDINGTVKLNQQMVDECMQIAKNLGYSAITKPMQFLAGGTDAAEFARIGIPATTIAAMPWHSIKHTRVYHTPEDKVDAIDPKAVAASIQIGIEFIKQKNSK